MFTDYKFWYIKRDDDGFITEAAIRFYEGAYVNDKYVRIKQLAQKDLKHLTQKFTKDVHGLDAKLYHPEDFGQIKTDEELAAFLNKEISKDKKRQVISQQKWLV